MIKQFVDYIFQNNIFTKKDKLLLAVSGGVDSVVLCHLCKQAGFEFAIAHCNFQLRNADSDRDENFVKKLAADLQIPFHVTKFNTKVYAEQNKLSTQVAARELRYNWFEKIRKENDYNFIVTAHHADDNIETVLMNFFRGTGINGLTGIKLINEKIRRPLLFARRIELENYLQQDNLQFVQDESNLHDDYTRNYFRNKVLPLISKTYPEVSHNILDNIERFKDIETLYWKAFQKIEKKLVKKEGDVFSISVMLLKSTPAMQTVLLEIIKPFGFKATQLNEVVRLLDSESGKYICSSSHRILKDRKHLFISSLNNVVHTAIIIEKEGQFNFSNGTINIEKTNKMAVSKSEQIELIDAAQIQYPLILRPWKVGDYFYPLGMERKKKLSKFFIDKKLLLADKEKVWVIEMNKKIIWVIGLRIDNRFKVTDKTKSVLKMMFTPHS